MYRKGNPFNVLLGSPCLVATTHLGRLSRDMENFFGGFVRPLGRKLLNASGCSFLLCSGLLAAACGSGEDEDAATPDANASGGAQSDIDIGSGSDSSTQPSGGTTSSGGSETGTGGASSSTSGGASSSGGSPSSDRCQQVVTGASGNLRIDYFEHGASPTLPAPLIGEWRHSSSADGSSRDVEFIDDTEMTGNTVARIQCQAGDAEEDAVCNNDVFDTFPFAFLVTALVETGECFDASFAAGISFRARSESGTETLQLIVTNPAEPLQPAESYSEQFTVTESWQTFTVDFESVTHSSEGNPDDPESPSFTPTELRAVGFIIRGVRGVDFDPGYLDPYALLIDDVSFY